MSRIACRQQGFSLIEVLLSLTLLAAVLVSMAGLMILGDRCVRSGRAATEALAVAQTILETIEGWGFSQTYATFGSYSSATQCSVDTRTNAAAAAWQAMLDSRLHNGHAEIEIVSLASGTPPSLAATSAMRVTVRVFWDEGQRSRSIRLATVRM